MATFHPRGGPIVSEPIAVDGLEDLEVAIAALPPPGSLDALEVQETADGTSWISHPVPGSGEDLLSAFLPASAARTHVRIRMATGEPVARPRRILCWLLPRSPKDGNPPAGGAS